MIIREALSDAAERLKPKHITCAADKNLGRLEAEILLAFTLKKPKEWLLAHPDYALRPTSYALFQRLIRRREKHMPIAYITGEKAFYGLPFKVTQDVLIPRPETEMLVELALRDSRLIWDVGTGSGAVAIAIAKRLPGARVLATDVSRGALAIAKRNARLNGVKNVTFLKANLLDATMRRTTHDARLSTPLIIVANLPYLPTSDKKKLTTDVVKYEPTGALFAGKTGMELNEKLLRQLAAFSALGGPASGGDIRFTSAFLEFDPPQSQKLRAIAKELFPHAKIKIHKDLARRDRVIEITRP